MKKKSIYMKITMSLKLIVIKIITISNNLNSQTICYLSVQYKFLTNEWVEI